MVERWDITPYRDGVYDYIKYKINKANKMIFKILIVLWLGVGVSTSLRLGHKQMSHDLYKDNLSAQNWYYGSISALDYRVRIFKAATT